VLIPFVTVVLSAWLDNEPLGAALLLGGLLVLAGVYVGALRPATPPTTPSGVTPPRSKTTTSRPSWPRGRHGGRRS